jgi:L-fucose isomerase-like protein
VATSTKIGVLFLGRKRPGFDPEWGAKIDQLVLQHFEDGADEIFVPAKAVDRVTLQSAVEACRSERCRVIVTLQTTMSDGRLAPFLAQAWGLPLVLWATPENPDGDMISSCSLVGVHIFASTLRQLGLPFEIVYGAPGDAETVTELTQAISRAVHGSEAKQALARPTGRGMQPLAGSSVGLIGYHAPGFINLHADPAVLSRELGVQLRHFSLQELMDEMDHCDEQEVANDLEQVHALNLPLVDVEDSDLTVQSQYYLALKRLALQERLDALAVRCWPELPNLRGHWPYFAMVRLTSEGFPTAMEGDVDGAISCLLGERLGFGKGYLTDWLEHHGSRMTLWHPGNAPFELCEPIGETHGPRLARHFNIRKPMVVAARLKAPQPITLFRLWRCDDRYHVVAFNANMVPPDRELQGSHGVAELPGIDLHPLFKRLCRQGMPHHLAVFRGHQGTILRDFANRAGLTDHSDGEKDIVFGAGSMSIDDSAIP